MLSRKTLRILMVLATKNRFKAEQDAAEAARRLELIDRHSITLDTYAASLSADLLSATQTGYDLLVRSRFLDAARRATTKNEMAKLRGEEAQREALIRLGQEMERRKSLEQLAEAAATSSDQLKSRFADHSVRRSPAFSSDSGKSGRTGRSPPDDRQASSFQT